jgi:outer membrane protein
VEPGLKILLSQNSHGIMRKLFLILSLGLFIFNMNTQAQQDTIWTLEKCITYSFEQNIQVRQGDLANEKNDLYGQQAKAQRNPSLNASVSQNFAWSRNTQTGTGFTGSNGTNYSASTGVTIFNASKITNLIKQADLEIKSGMYTQETLKESISLNILNAYVQVLYSEELVNNSRKQIESTSSQLNLAEERLALEIISQADLAQVKSQLASEKFTLASSESQLAIAKVNLMQLMEYPVTEDFEIAHPDITKSINENREPVVKTVYETALGIKPQVKDAAISKEIAAIDQKIAKAAYFPTLSASAGIGSGFSSNTSDPYFSQVNNSLMPTLGFSLAIPIYQKKQAKTSMAIAKIGYRNAELSETNIKNQLRKNIEQSCQDVISAQIEYEAGLEEFNAAKESANLSDEKFTQGIINSVDYLVSKTKLILSESQLLQSKYNLIFSYKILDFYMGIPLSL